MDAAAIEKLEKLGTLLEKGLLTKEEFERQKTTVLNGGGGSPSPAATPTPVVAPVPEAMPASTGPVSPVPPPVPSRGGGMRLVRAAVVLSGGLILGLGVVGMAGFALLYSIYADQIVSFLFGPSESEIAAQESANQAWIQAEEAQRQAAAEAAAPRVQIVPADCDDRCSDGWTDCTYVRCIVTNAGGTDAAVNVDLVAGKTRKKAQAYATIGGAPFEVEAKFTGVKAKSCGCEVLSVEALPDGISAD